MSDACANRKRDEKIERLEICHWKYLCAALGSILLGLLAAPGAQAVPSMGRQTGYECAKCHTVFPELTRFGRQFKLGAFAMSSAKWDEKALAERIPVSGLLQISRIGVRNTTAGGATPETDFPRDRETIVQAAGLYYGGKITEKTGALIQYNWDGIEKKWGMEMFDARYADGFTLAGKELTFGVTLNNNPTVSDIYNSTPAWRFPHTETAAPVPAATLIDMTLASQVGGVGVYGLWDDLIYAEFATYRTARKGAFRFMGLGVTKETVLDGNAPYWRFALQRESGPHSVALGTYGMTARVLADREMPSLGSDRYRNVGFDGFYQFVKGEHVLSVSATRIREKQTWNTSFDQGLVSNPNGTLRTLRANVHYYFQRKWGGGLEYFQTSGSTDDLRYNTGDAVMGSASGSPNSKGYITELNYLPIQNVKLALRYTAYRQFNGASTDYMPGRNASDNNNLFLLGWILF